MVALELADAPRDAWYRKRQVGLLGEALLIVPGRSGRGRGAWPHCCATTCAGRGWAGSGASGWAARAGRWPSRARWPGWRGRHRPPRLTTAALAVLFAIVPLYGTLVALDPPGRRSRCSSLRGGRRVRAARAGGGAVVVPAGLRAPQPAAIRFGFLGGGIATLVAALFGFDPPTGLGLGLGVTGVGFAGLALSAADAATTRICVRAFLWSALAAALVALAMLVSHRPAAIYAYDNARAVGTFLNPNELAAYTLVGTGLRRAAGDRDPRARPAGAGHGARAGGHAGGDLLALGRAQRGLRGGGLRAGGAGPAAAGRGAGRWPSSESA